MYKLILVVVKVSVESVKSVKKVLIELLNNEKLNVVDNVWHFSKNEINVKL